MFCEGIDPKSLEHTPKTWTLHALLHVPMHVQTGVCAMTQLEIPFVVNTDGQKFVFWKHLEPWVAPCSGGLVW